MGAGNAHHACASADDDNDNDNDKTSVSFGVPAPRLFDSLLSHSSTVPRDQPLSIFEDPRRLVLFTAFLSSRSALRCYRCLLVRHQQEHMAGDRGAATYLCVTMRFELVLRMTLGVFAALQVACLREERVFGW